MARHSQGIAGTATTRDGRDLFFMRHPGPPGADVPTVVFESGLSANRSYWAATQVTLSRWAPTVVYDRSGLGRSEVDDAPRTLDRMSRDLNDLLDHLGRGPFVLAGHSWGGPIVRVAAAARPERIAGLVLIDATDEACDVLFRKSTRRAEELVQTASAVLARFGLLGVAFRSMLRALPADAKADMRAEGFTVRTVRTRRAELDAVAPDLAALREQPPELPDVAVTVISGGLASAGMGRGVREAVNASHQYRANLSERGRHVLATRSGHQVPVTEPELVAVEIRHLLDSATPRDELGMP